MNRSFRSASILAVATFSLAASAHATVETFTDPITLSNTQAAGAWYTDRYAPAGFESGVWFDGDYRLKHSIGAADGANFRPGAYTNSFYNTQGRKYDLAAGTTTLSIDLYVDSSWQTSGRRMAGLWGTAVDSSDVVSGYPIVEFYSDGVNGEFRSYNTTSGAWISMGLPTGFSYDSWTTLEISLVSGNWVTSVGDSVIVQSAGTSASLANVILQGHNTAEGVNYDIYWDNLTSVPTPGALALMGIAGLAGSRRRRA